MAVRAALVYLSKNWCLLGDFRLCIIRLSFRRIGFLTHGYATKATEGSELDSLGVEGRIVCRTEGQ